MGASESRWQETPRVAFARRFAELYEAAGNPKLKRVESAAKARMAAAQPRGPVASAQRISDWRTGRNVPAKFDFFLPVLLTLIDEARKATDPVPQLLLSVREWEQLWRTADGWNPDAADAPSPYLGLEPFGRADTEVFFGRTRPTEEVTELIRRVTAADGSGGIVMLVGASGAGKSSLLAAGVIPALTAGDAGMRTGTSTGADADSGADTDAGAGADSAAGAGAGAVEESVAGQSWAVATLTPGADPLAALTSALGGTDPQHWATDRPRLVVVDQLEELFTLGADDQQCDEFLSALQELALPRPADRSVVILAIRADFYGRCLDHPILEESLKHRSYLLGPMRLNELAAAITRPAELAGYRLEPGLEELVITELCGASGRADRRGYDPGALPLLSHVMRATWQRRDGGRLTIDGYRAAGGVLGSVAATAEHAWEGLSEFQQSAGKQLLLELIAIGQDSKDTRRRVPRADLLGLAVQTAEAALEALTRARLITVDADFAYLTHEIVLDAWPRLRGWIDQDRLGYLERQRLQTDAADWLAAARDPSRLYRGARLDALADLGDDDPIGSVARDFLAASRTAHTRARRRSHTIKAIFGLLGVIVTVLAAVAFIQRDSMSSQRRDAIVAAVLANADRLQDTDPSISAQLDLVANNLRPNDPAIRARMLSTQLLPLGTPLPGASAQDDYVVPAAFRPDGRFMATTDGKRISLWDVGDPHHPRAAGAIDLHRPILISELAFSGDGNVLISADPSAGATLWDVHDPQRPVAVGSPIPARPVDITAYGFAVSGSTLAVTTAANTVQLWDIRHPAAPVLLHTLSGIHRGNVSAIAFAADGTRLATASTDDLVVRLWDTTNPTAPVALGTSTLTGMKQPNAIAFSPDGHLVAVAGDGPSVPLWNIEDPRNPRSVGTIQSGHTGQIISLQFAPDNRTMLTAAVDGVAKLWKLDDLTQPRPWGTPLQTAEHNTFAATFGPDGRTVVTNGTDGTVRLWSPADELLAGLSEGLLGMAFSPDGNLLAVSWDDGEIQLWDTHDPRHPRRLARREHGDWAGSLTISPDGRTLVGSEGEFTSLYDIADPTVIRPLARWQSLPNPAGNPINSVQYAFSPDSKTLVTMGDNFTGPDATEHGYLQVWDVFQRDKPTALQSPTELGDVVRGADRAGTIWATTLGAHTIQLWRLANGGAPGKIGSPIIEPDADGLVPALSPDGKFLAAIVNGTIKVWDISDPVNPRTIVSTAHDPELKSFEIMFSPDGNTLATVGNPDGARQATLVLWDFADHRRLVPAPQTLMPATNYGNVVFSPAPGTLAGQWSGGIQLLDLDPRHAEDRICSVTRDVLTPDNWSKYVPQLPFRRPCGA
ncbi:hypothetical protein ACIP5Y_27190 [Nocardia sp. NPDC088792]|uniref:nSTAND1 domain-containing NTPase n=1 Tax=Nocardia sp. NPDC088792 TaxID=3364332 RepID=UPI0038050D15